MPQRTIAPVCAGIQILVRVVATDVNWVAEDVENASGRSLLYTLPSAQRWAWALTQVA